jgi:hypothetical protein
MPLLALALVIHLLGHVQYSGLGVQTILCLYCDVKQLSTGSMLHDVIKEPVHTSFEHCTFFFSIALSRPQLFHELCTDNVIKRSASVGAVVSA